MGNFLPTFYDDFMAIEHNQKVRVNIGTVLVGIFLIRPHGSKCLSHLDHAISHSISQTDSVVESNRIIG